MSGTSGDVTVINGENTYVIPGLTDMHVHIMNYENLLLFIANGVTTVRNMWGAPEILDTRNKIKNRELIGPDIYTAESLLDGPGGWRQGCTVVTSIPQAGDAVLECVKTGYDYVKVYELLNSDVYYEIIKTAHENNIKVVSHIPQKVGVPGVIESRQYSIEHCHQLSETDIKILAESGTWWCPTTILHH